MTERPRSLDIPTLAPRVVPIEFANSYKDFIDVLQDKARILSSIGVFTSEEIAEHYLMDDEIGRSFFEEQMEGERLMMQDKGIINPSDVEVLKHAITQYKKITYKLRVEGKSS